MRVTFTIIISILFFAACRTSKPIVKTTAHHNSTVLTTGSLLNINRKDFIKKAGHYLGTPYLYGSANPAKGLDCSGLFYILFQHCQIASPRSSYDYENVGKTISVNKCQPGDILLFTASNPNKIGHMGLITQIAPVVKFIHSSTSKGVIISEFKGYYKDHFVKAIQVFL